MFMFNNGDCQHRLRELHGRLKSLHETPKCVRHFSEINNGQQVGTQPKSMKKSQLLQLQSEKDQLIQQLMQLVNSQADKIKSLYEEIRQIKDENEFVRLNFSELEKAHCQLLAARLGDAPRPHSEAPECTQPIQKQDKPVYHGNIIGIFKFPTLQLYEQFLQLKNIQIDNLSIQEFDRLRNGLDRMEASPVVSINLDVQLQNIKRLMQSMQKAMDDQSQLVELSRKSEEETISRCKQQLDASTSLNKKLNEQNNQLSSLLNESRHNYENEIQHLKSQLGRLMLERDQMKNAAAFYYLQSENAVKVERVVPPKKTPNILYRR